MKKLQPESSTPEKGKPIPIPKYPPDQPSSSLQRKRIVTPLFDPHGIGSALADSTDDEYQNSSSDHPCLVNDGKPQNTTDAEGSRIEHGLVRHTEDANRRGRRRRSSEFVTLQAEVPQNKKNDSNSNNTTEETYAKRDESTASKSARLWWQRGDEGEQDRAEDLSTSQTAAMPSSSIIRQRPLIDTNTKQARSRQPSDGTTSSSQSPMVRSPAAAFLSSMNDMLASPPSSVISIPGRNYSLSPTRNGVQQISSSASRDLNGSALPNVRSTSASQDSAGHLGLARAAAQLYNTVQASPSLQSMSSFSGNHSTIVKVDEEGARLGPGGRYMLGKTIGYGGFSTVREAWDMGEGAKSDTVDDEEAKNWHRVAVKIIYSSENAQKENGAKDTKAQESQSESDELELWESIPSHPNLLPLLYHERIHVDETTMASGSGKRIDFLVMPFCEGNLLTYVRLNGESLVDNRIGTPSRKDSIADTGLERDSSNRSSRDVERPESPSSRYNRTGSGFIPHGHRSNTVTDRIISAPLSVLLARSSSMAASPASNTSPGRSIGSAQTGSLFRSTSMRQRQASVQPSRGLPVTVAKDVLRQIAEALLCLHYKAGILHGDIKLENVLGQQWTAPHTHFSSTASEEAMSSSRGHTRSNGSEIPSNLLGEPESLASICWRVADFGLARRIPSKEEVKGEPDGHWIPSLDHARTYGHRTSKHDHTAISQTAANLRRHSSYAGGVNVTQPRSQAGSLAYAAPEIFLVPDTDDPDAISPFAPDIWALGCISYALFAGRLPFSDTFEPRLQNKIMQGKWEMPERLKRRNQRPEKRRKMDDFPSSFTKADSSSTNRAESFGESSNARRQTIQQVHSRESSTPGMAGKFEEGGSVDMSASMPSLPPRRSEVMTKSGSNQSIIIADQSDMTMSQNIGEEDPISDDEIMDVEFDGKSKDRVAIRRILHGLLEPDASKRWTIIQLLQDEWISGETAAGVEPSHEDVVAGLPASSSSESFKQVLNSDVPSVLREEIDTLRQGNAAHATIPEYDDVPELQQRDFADLQKKRSSYFSGYVDDSQDDISRGRAPRRAEVEKDPTKKSQPIAIDRSKSRSRSRVRDDSTVWGPDITSGGGFNWRQQQQQQQQQENRQSPSYEYRPQLGTSTSDSMARPSKSSRSSSVDQHQIRGRRLAKSQNVLDETKNGHPLKKGEQSESRSASRSGRNGRGGSRSTSRSRRAELDLIMPQLSLHRSHLAHELEDHSSNEVSPAAAAALHPDDHNVERSSIWKSPLRARDRLVANLKGGSGHTSSGASTPKDRKTSTADRQDPAIGQGMSETQNNVNRTVNVNHTNEDRPWWQRGHESKQ